MSRICKPVNGFCTSALVGQFATDPDDSVSMNWSEFAGSVPDEVDGKDAKEGCMSELLFPVCHQLWPVAVGDAGEKRALNLM